MEDNEIIAERNTEADSKLIEWSLKMVRDGRVDFSEFTVGDLYRWLTGGSARKVAHFGSWPSMAR